MPTVAPLAIDPHLLQRLKGIELQSRFLVRGLYSNRHRTADHGLSTEFVEHREYRRGDELRSVDWRVLARTDRLYVKVHEMESNMRVHLVLDTSASMRVPPPAGLPSKLELAASIVGAVAMMVETQQDSVGLLCVGDRIEEHIPARQGKNHLHLIYQHLANPPGGGGGRFGELVLEASSRLGRRGMVFLVTDGLDDPETLLSAMKRLRVRQQDVTLIQLLDRNEIEFPFDRMTEFRHPETGARLVGDPAGLRAKYLKRLGEHLDKVESYAKKAQADYLRLDNGADLTRLLSLHFMRRLQRGGALMLNPLMLLGLAGLAAPIIIHLIQRQRLKPQQLATLQFLDEEDIANAFAPVPRDPLQLLLRLLLLGLFILLMSRLVTGGKEVGPRTMAVVLDQSMSMQQKLSETTSLFDRSKEQILKLIDGLGPDDRLSLVLVGDKVNVETGYLQDKAALRKAAEKFTVSDSGALALVPAVHAAVDQLRSRREVNSCVLVFSDHQRVNYAPYIKTASAAESANIDDSLRKSLDGSGVTVFLIDEKPPQGKNLAIERARFSPEQVYIGASSRLTAVVRNYSEEPQTTNVTVSEGEQTGQQRTLSLAPGEAAHVDLVQRFESPVDSACRVEIEEDALPGDNRFHLPMRVKERRQILLVSPAAAEDDADRGLELSYRGVDLLAYALNPGEMLGLGSGTNINVKRVTPQVLQRTSLPIYSLIVLYGVTDLAPQSTKDLTAFVKSGGGLWLIPDREMSPLRFNEAFGPLLQGFAVGQLKQPESSQPLGRDEGRLTHPMLLPLVREDWGSVREAYFNEYFGIEAAGAAAVALRTADGDPLAVIVRQERGQIFVQLFGSDLEGSSLARSTAFVPFVQQVSGTLSQRGEPPRPDVMRVGEVLRMRLPEFRNLKGDVLASGPESQKFSLTGPEGDEIRVEGLLKAGAYEVEHSGKKGGRTRWLAVNGVLGESNLEVLSEADQAEVFGTENAMRLPYKELAGQFSNRHELAGLMIVLVLIALVIEALLGAWQSRQGARRKRGAAA